MAKILVRPECDIYDGMPVTFKAPCACKAVDGLKLQCGDEYREFTFKDAHGNDLTGIGNLFDKGAIVKVVLDTEGNGAFVQNADTNAYIEGKFADMVHSVNGQKGDVILTPERLGAAASSVTEITVTASFHDTGSPDRDSTLVSKLYTSGKLFVLEIPHFYVPQRYDGYINFSSLPEGYRVIDISTDACDSSGGIISPNFGLSADQVTQAIEEHRIKISHSSTTNRGYRMRIYGVVDEDAASGSGGVEPDWVQAVIDAAQNAVAIAEEARDYTDTFAAKMDALDTGLTDAREEIDSLTQAQEGIIGTLAGAANTMASMQRDIADLKGNGGGAPADLSKLETAQGIEKTTEGDTVYIKGKAATSAELGMVKVTQENGVGIGSDGQLKVRRAEKQTITERKSDYQPIVPSTLEHAVQSVTHQQMGDKYYPDDMGFENGSSLPVSYAAMMSYLKNSGLKGAGVVGAVLEPITDNPGAIVVTSDGYIITDENGKSITTMEV